MDDFLDVAGRIEAAATAQDAFSILAGIAKQHGFGAAACMEIPTIAPMTPDSLLLVTMPESWVEHYVASGFAQVDPVLRRAAREISPFTWADASIGVQQPSLRVMNEATEFGLRSGVTFPMHGPNGYRAEITFAGEHVNVDPRVMRALRFMAIATHDRAQALIRAESGAFLPELTARERECLHWVAAGKSDWAISQILSISETTVHWHVERAKRKFGASTRIQAIVTAIRIGILRI